ncbi:MAG: alpha-E domain-containing protein [Pseudomonadota bacterium]
MLSRSAENLFWISRYMERAENLARLLDMGYRVARLGDGGEGATNEWESVILSAGAANGFAYPLEAANQETTSEWLMVSGANASSVKSCFGRVRANARAIRTSLTSEVWEAVNDAWMDIRDLDHDALAGSGLPGAIDWIKQRVAQFRGAVDSTLLRDEGYDFVRLGIHHERADSTARLLDVKYHVLLPSEERIGGSVDYYQWVSILRAANSLLSYQRYHKDGVKPWHVAEYLILNRESPRSLTYCYQVMLRHFANLAEDMGQRWPCHDLAEATAARLAGATIDSVFAGGLHEFLSSFIISNNQLADAVGSAYGFTGALSRNENAVEAERSA